MSAPCARFAALVALALFAIPQTAFAATNVSGAIIADTTWTAAGSPYVMTGDVEVNPGVTLTLEPGVSVHASHSATDLTIASGATLVADAAGGPAIVFSAPTDTPSAGVWRGLVFESGSLATLDNVTVSNAVNALVFSEPSDTLLTIRNLRIDRFSSYALRMTLRLGHLHARGHRGPQRLRHRHHALRFRAEPTRAPRRHLHRR